MDKKIEIAIENKKNSIPNILVSEKDMIKEKEIDKIISPKNVEIIKTEQHKIPKKISIKELYNIINVPDNSIINVDTGIVKGTVFEETFMQFINSIKATRICTIDQVIEIIHLLQEFENDCHIAIVGQNGVGKSFVLNIFMKKTLGEKMFENFMFAKHDVNDLVNFVLHNTNTMCGIDELNQYFNYKMHTETEQNHLISMLELARENRIGFVGCIRDVRKITKNYRDGKISIVIWVIDRFKEGGSYAAVFVANPLIEGMDKFGFDLMQVGEANFKDMRDQLEKCPTFIGYMFVPNAYEILTTEEIEKYRKEKAIAKAYAHLRKITKDYVKLKIDFEEFKIHILKLKDILPRDVLIKELKKIPTKKSRRMKQANSEDIETAESELGE